MTPELQELLEKAAVAVAAMTPEERAQMFAEQRLSYARAEAGMGSDADEAAYRLGMEQAGSNVHAVFSDADQRHFYEQGRRDACRARES